MSSKSEAIKPVRVTIIGCGNMARHHIAVILNHFKNTEIPVVCEPDSQQYEATLADFKSAGRPAPFNEPDLATLLEKYGHQLDTAFIITPHMLHHDQTIACLDAGLDVLLEKPMVMNVAEAKSLIEARDRSGRLLVVAFNGSLSPEIRTAAGLLRSGELGPIQSISATIWQNWRQLTGVSWRQMPEKSGGGFMFDTGAHMLNTTADLAGESFVEVAAWLDNRGANVDIVGTVMARLESGALVTMHGSGETVPSCASDIRVFCSKAILHTGAWGKWLELQRSGEPEFSQVKVPPSAGAWEQFLAVREGEIPNPSPPEVGLRMAHLWDAIQESAKNNGLPVSLDN